MEKYFKLNKPVYYNVDHIRVTNKYDKREGGYIAYVELVNLRAEDFIKRIETMDIAYIQDWLDGKNKLEWK